MGKLEKGVNDLLTKNPDLASEWNNERNEGMRPDEIAYEYQKAVKYVSRGQGCPICHGHNLNGVRKIDSIWSRAIFGISRPEISS